MSALLQTDIRDYGLIETFNNTPGNIQLIPIADHLLTGGALEWAYSGANQYQNSTAGELIVNALSLNTEVAGISHQTGVTNWYIELGNLATNEQVRLYVKKTSVNIDRDAVTFDAIGIYFKNQGGSTLNTRIGSIVAGSLDTTDQTALDEHVSGFDPTTTRFGAHVSFDGTAVTCTIAGVTKTLKLNTTLGTFDNNDYVGLHFNAPAGTGKIYEVRAW